MSDHLIDCPIVMVSAPSRATTIPRFSASTATGLGTWLQKAATMRG